jgi:tetratricopeptide (TPR) repeat protein
MNKRRVRTLYMNTWKIDIRLVKERLIYIFFLSPFLAWNCGVSDQPSHITQKKVNLLPYHYILGNELFNFHSFKEAAEEYEKVLGIDPNYIPAIQNLANSYIKLNKDEEAIKNWKKLLKLQIDEKLKINTYYNIGVVSFKNKKKETSIFYTQKALQLSMQHKNNQVYPHAKANLKAFKEFYNLTDPEIANIVKNFKNS